MYRSISVVKADQARKKFGAEGQGIVWAVISSGIDATHPHFRKYANLDLAPPLFHRDFSGSGDPLKDEFGHGTMQAGIIAGEITEEDNIPILLVRKAIGEHEEDKVASVTEAIRRIAGMAPKCKLVSFKVLDRFGLGRAATAIQALAAVEEMNDYGREIRIHGVDLGLGYPYEPTWFACGQSPLCIAVDRLVQSGIVVVVPAGNTGYGTVRAKQGDWDQGLILSINDPGNSERAITVGSTHRDRPNLYGVSYFSAKGPTLDGRVKPDLVAPGEYIASSIAMESRLAGKRMLPIYERGDVAPYLEDSGTCRACAHVSGLIAAFLSIRRELIGRPDDVKKAFISTAADLKRKQDFQGSGLVDLLHALEPEASARPLPRPKADRLNRLFISYAHEDEGLKRVLISHLSSLNRQGLIEIWEDRRVLPGGNVHEAIKTNLDLVEIIVLLVSADFLASEYCYSVELKRAIDRHRSGNARVIPIIVRPVDWSGTPFSDLAALPIDGKAVSTFDNADEAWLGVAQGIRRVVETLPPVRNV
jgi:hypothetical protein